MRYSIETEEKKTHEIRSILVTDKIVLKELTLVILYVYLCLDIIVH